MKTNPIFLLITIVSTVYLVSLFVRAIFIPAWKEFQYQKKEQKHIENGLRPFFFEHGKIKIFAKTKEQADSQYRELKRDLRKIKASKK